MRILPPTCFASAIGVRQIFTLDYLRLGSSGHYWSYGLAHANFKLFTDLGLSQYVRSLAVLILFLVVYCQVNGFPSAKVRCGRLSRKDVVFMGNSIPISVNMARFAVHFHPITPSLFGRVPRGPYVRLKLVA